MGDFLMTELIDDIEEIFSSIQGLIAIYLLSSDGDVIYELVEDSFTIDAIVSFLNETRNYVEQMNVSSSNSGWAVLIDGSNFIHYFKAARKHVFFACIEKNEKEILGYLKMALDSLIAKHSL